MSLRAWSETTVRLDRYLVERGWFPSRERARRAVLAGAVTLAGEVVRRPSTPVAEGIPVELLPEAHTLAQQASRAGGKLGAALDHFGVDVEGRVWLDVGASNGGFTQVLLERGAYRVYALDVGRGQLDERLAADPRVVPLEGINARYLKPDDLPEGCGGIVVDVSFISLRLVAPPLLPHLEPGGWWLPLIKPQFEVGAEGLGKGGIVRDEALRQRVVVERADELALLAEDLQLLGLFDSPVVGMGGNREAFACLRRRL